MEVIRNKDGEIIQRSRNLAGIRRYVGKHLIKTLAIDKGKHCSGKLSILFENGDSFECNFGSHGVLRRWVSYWKNVYGAPLLMDGKDCGTVAFSNPALRECNG